MKYNTLKAIFMAIILIFVFTSVSLAGNRDYRNGQNHSHYNQNNNDHHYNYQADNSHSFRQPHAFYNNHKQQKRYPHYYRRNHTSYCTYRKQGLEHLNFRHCLSPYGHFSAGFFHVPGFAFSFSTGGHR